MHDSAKPECIMNRRDLDPLLEGGAHVLVSGDSGGHIEIWAVVSQHRQEFATLPQKQGQCKPRTVFQLECDCASRPGSSADNILKLHYLFFSAFKDEKAAFDGDL